jgi:2-oxoglutarate ferredoxin oxidoreductase subunit beta
MATPATESKPDRKDYVSDQEVRWCPGCGDYAILAQMQRLLPEIGVPRENVVFVSGIGCSARFPYYMNTYGFHTIHGRAPAIATGLKAINPELSVWVVTGDGDGLSIGGNHLLHCLRRNVDVKILLFNNRIYGLTKGQTSPTSPFGSRTKTSPDGSIESPVEPLRFALAAGAGFLARTIDNHVRHLTGVLRRAAAHRGTAFIEIYQNCVVFNDQAFGDFAGRAVRDDHTLDLVDRSPMVFGKEGDRGLRFDGRTFEVVPADHPDVLVHDENAADPTIAYGLSRLAPPDFPVPIGVFRDRTDGPFAETFEDRLSGQIRAAKERDRRDLAALLTGRNTWTVG